MAKWIRCGAVVMCAMAFLAGRVMAQEHPKGEHPKGEHPKGEHPKGDEKPKAEHPGPAELNDHQKSQTMFEGEWEATAKGQSDPSQPVQEWKGTCKNTLVLGGRFLQMEYKGELLGQPYEGYGLSGYDPEKKKHTLVWMDSLTTQMMHYEGECTDGCKTTTLTAELPGPNGTTMKSRSVTRVVSPTEHVFEIYVTDPSGKESKMLEIVYQKKK